MTKPEKKKPAYSMWNSIRFIIGRMWKWYKKSVIYMFLRPPFAVAGSFLMIFLSVQVVAAVTEGRGPAEVLQTIGLLTGAMIFAGIMDKALTAASEKYSMLTDTNYQTELFGKCISSDYENMESPAGQTRLSKAMDNTSGDQTGTRRISDIFSTFVKNAMGVVFYGFILLSLNPWLLLVATVTTVSVFFISKISINWDYRNKDNWMPYARKLGYLQTNSRDFTRAKDMRLYNMTGWFKTVFTDTLAQRQEWRKKEVKVNIKTDALSETMSLLRDGFAYGFLITLIFARGLSAADFVLFFGVVGGFSAWLMGLVRNFGEINWVHVGFSEMREFLDYPDNSNYGPGAPLPEDTFEIQFKNVTFRHPGSDVDVVKNLSFTIGKGEKLAIVGLNGAGKTTLVKLLCGLYNPVQGEILVNGIPINAYNRDEYYTLFSAVFQEITLLATSISRNISCLNSNETDRAQVQKVLDLTGLADKVNSLPQGMETMLVKSVYEDAVDLSGGEQQKLALARALYKLDRGGKALVLDEPTAALDPIAENNIYMEYNRMSKGRTSLFISHRLASTRFCDRIFFFEKGEIVETGSHDELMAQKGRYYEMFEIQSHYYKEGSGDDAA